MVANKAATVGTACALTFLSYLIILTRLSLRKVRHEAYKIDDYLMGSAMILYAVYTAVIPVAVCIPVVSVEMEGKDGREVLC